MDWMVEWLPQLMIAALALGILYLLWLVMSDAWRRNSYLDQEEYVDDQCDVNS